MGVDNGFGFHPACRVLYPDASGLHALIDCIKSRCSITATQNTAFPISKSQHHPQWLVCETSGSTGTPKAIRRHVSSWIDSFEITASKFGISQNDTYGVLGSLGHSLSLYATLEAFHIGADFCLLTGQNPKDQIEAIHRNNISVLYATPTQLYHLSTAIRFCEVPIIAPVKRIFIGGGTLSPDANKRFAQVFPNAILTQFYGSSETSFITISDDETPTHSVGRAYPDVAIKFDHLEHKDGKDIGEICVKSPYLFHNYGHTYRRYYLPEDGFFRTGEIGYQDAAGYVYLLGRRDRMVTVSDVNVYPEKIEAAVQSLAGVDQCAVITVPDTMRGHTAICFVQSHVKITAATIRKYCRTTLGAPFVPKKVIPLNQLPHLDSGKVDLVRLKNWYTDNQ